MKQYYVKLHLFCELSGHERVHIIILQYVLSCHDHASCPGPHELQSECLKKCQYSLNKAPLQM